MSEQAEPTVLGEIHLTITDRGTFANTELSEAEFLHALADALKQFIQDFLLSHP